jgi:PhzF family phenazine biosynthesis protein
MSDVLHYAAFTDEGRGGNPAGVVLDARGWSDADRLALAARLGYSECAFAEPTAEPGRFVLRFFSPLDEVGFCGHATIATAVALAERDGPGTVTFETRSGDVVVGTQAGDDGVVATLTSVPTSVEPLPDAVLDEVLAALRWSRDELDAARPPVVAFGGMHHPLLFTATRERLARLDYDVDRLGDLSREHGWTTVSLLHVEREDLVHARNPFPVGGVVEDPATGAAAAALGGWLRTSGHDRSVPVTVLQGHDMGRPCRLVVDVAADDGRTRVSGAASRFHHVGAETDLWRDYVAAHPEHAGEEPPLEAFGDSLRLGDELLALVTDGPKRATAELAAQFEADGDAVPRAGDHWVVADGAGVPRVVLRTTEVRVGVLESVDDAFAWDEGEDDRTRDSWLREHRRYFRRSCERLDLDPARVDELDVVFERFEVVWPRGRD